MLCSNSGIHSLVASTPNKWCLENVALLLYGCGTAIVKGVLLDMVNKDCMDDAVMILYYMANHCVANNFSDEFIENDIA